MALIRIQGIGRFRRLPAILVLIGAGSFLAGIDAAGQTPATESGPAIDSEMARALAMGDAAFESGEYREALSAYSRISPVEIPVPAQNRLAMSYHMLEMWDEAKAIYRVATVRDREYAPSHSNLGALYYADGEYKDAEESSRRSLELAPGSSVAQHNLHAARYAREHEREASESRAGIVDANPLLISGVREEYLEVELLIDPATKEELRSLALRGDIFVARKMFEDAILEYARYLDIDSHDAGIRNKLGITYHQVQRVYDAEDEYRKALRVNPYFVPALNNLGTLEQGRGDYLRALDYYRQALDIDPDSATVMQNLGACLFAMERYEEGFRAYVRAVQLDPEIFDRLDNRGGTLIQTTAGNQAMASYYLAKLFAQNGEADRAMSQLYRAVEAGFSEPDLLGDPVFDLLSSDDRFRRLVASLDEPR